MASTVSSSSIAGTCSGVLAKLARFLLLALYKVAAETSNTTTTPGDPCASADTACKCAAPGVCVWLTTAGGSGRCMNVAAPGQIDCHLCAEQDHCAAISCPIFTTACNCANSPGCRWDVTSSSCVRKINYGTPCTACPSQSHCRVTPPKLVSSNPAHGGSHSSGTNLRIAMWFDRPVNWCKNPYTTQKDLSFWCDGMVRDYSISKTQVQFSSTSMRVDMTSLMQQLSLSTERTCGLSIGNGRICDDADIAYVGLSKGSYSFRLADQESPSLQNYDPSSLTNHVKLDGSVDLIWSEPIKLNPTVPKAVLHRLDTGTTGQTVSVQSSTVALHAPTAAIVTASRLRIHLDGQLRSGMLYSLELPEGAVLDMAGNPSLSIPLQAFKFQAETAYLRTPIVKRSDGPEVGLVILGLISSVVCILGLGIGGVKLYRANSHRLDFLSQIDTFKRQRAAWEPTPVQSRPISMGSATKGPAPTFAEATAAAEAAQRAASAAADRMRGQDEPDTNKGSGTWASRPMPDNSKRASTGGSAPSAKVHPNSGQGFNAGQKRRSAASSTGPAPDGAGTGTGGKAAGNSSPPPSSSPPAAQNVDSSAPPEVKAVEKRLHGLMDKPLADRKKVMKELMLEYHPDKNSAPHAKEMFQYVNNSKSWFLHEA